MTEPFVTKDQEDTRLYIEHVIRYYDPEARVEHHTGPDIKGLVTYKTVSPQHPSQFVQIWANGKPAFDEETGNKHS